MGGSHPLRVIFIGFLLVLVGFIGPVLMVLGVVPASFGLSFISHTASVGGVFLGFYGGAMVIGDRRS